MRVAFDTNIVLDVVLARGAHYLDAARLSAMADDGTIVGILAATSLTTVDYVAARALGRRAANASVRQLLGIFEIAPVDRAILAAALDLDFPDYEDAVIHEAARAAGAEAIVTRDAKGFRNCSLPAFEPEVLLAMLTSASEE